MMSSIIVDKDKYIKIYDLYLVKQIKLIKITK